MVWRELHQRIATAGEIDRWFKRWPGANVGIVTGRISRIIVVDVDVRHSGPDSVAEVEAAHGPLPPTVEAASGGGGRHFYYAHPGATLANRVAIRPGIDVRSDARCIVAPPSVHPSGRRYSWVEGRSPDELALAPVPAHFFPRAGALHHSRLHWRRLIREGIGQGQRNNTIASLTGHLLRRGVDLDVVLELLLAWNRTHAARCGTTKSCR